MRAAQSDVISMNDMNDEISREGKKDICGHADKMNQPVKVSCLGDRWARQREAEQGVVVAASRGRSERADKLELASVLMGVWREGRTVCGQAVTCNCSE